MLSYGSDQGVVCPSYSDDGAGNILPVSDIPGDNFSDSLPYTVDDAIEWYSKEYPELTNGRSLVFLPLGRGDGFAPGRSLIFINNKFNNESLTVDEREEMFETVGHELLHTHLNRFYGSTAVYIIIDKQLDGQLHDWVTLKASDIVRWQQGSAINDTGKPSIYDWPKP